MSQKKNNDKKNSIVTFFQKILNRKRIRVTIISLIAAYVIMSLLILSFTQFGALFSDLRFVDFEVGSIAEEDIIVERDITYIDVEATEIRREAVEKLVAPVFNLESGIITKTIDKYELFVNVFLFAINENVTAEKVFLEIQSVQPGVISKDQVAELLNQDNYNKILNQAKSILSEILKFGLIQFHSDITTISPSGIIEIWRDSEGGNVEKERVTLSHVITTQTIDNEIKKRIPENTFIDNEFESIIMLVSLFADENCFYNEELTRKLKNDARTNVEPSYKRLVKGERIIRKDFIVTEEDIQLLNTYKEYTTTVSIYSIVGTILFTLVIFVVGSILIVIFFRRRRLIHSTIIMILVSGGVFLLTALIVRQVIPINEFDVISIFLPTAFFAMMITLLTDEQLGIIVTLLFSSFLFLLTELNGSSFVFAFLSGVFATIVVKNIEKRIDLIRASLLLSLSHLVLILIIGLIQRYDVYHLLISSGIVLLNGFLCAILNLGFLPIFEHVLNYPTRFRLMELSDLNAPILKKMLTLAPGTYNHSVSVANLAESACREIGENSLLARVGAYFHDIGKIEQSEYFIENQTNGNKHDDLKASLSAAVIKSHVKIGVEKAKELGLPKEVLDIIGQHHGNSVVSYFYNRAVEENPNSRVSEQDFCYAGIPPTSKVAAVVMLADTVEAATRILKKPTVAKLEKFIWDLIVDKFNEGQLNECELTFKDLEIIKKTFVQILAGYFHTRIEYPKNKEQLNE